MFDVIQPGLETSIQDYPGRIGFWNQGFPPSGPMDSWSFRLANLLVGNPVGAAGLEAQYMGPTLKFSRDGVIAICGADMQAKLDGQPVPLWESIAVKSGQTLAMSAAKQGVRAYIAFAGGIDTPPWLGSRSTFHKAGVGGMEGHALKPGQSVPVAAGKGTPGRKVKPEARPTFPTDKTWTIEVVAGPQRRLDRRGRAAALPHQRLEALGQERPHRLPPGRAAMDLHREGLQEVARERRRALQHHRSRLSPGRHQSRRPDAHHPGQ